MEEHDLGPNGGLVYCMEYIEKNIDWLLERLDQAVSGNHQNQSQQQQQQQSPSTIIPRRYIIFDFPGQVSQPSYLHVRVSSPLPHLLLSTI